jgi:putative Mn2+ efflux pump MntP
VEFVTSFLIAIGLAMDVFAVSLGIGTTGRANDLRSRLRLAFHFGFFQALMTLAGWLAGSAFATLIQGIDHWIALVLLAYVGINMIRSGCHPGDEMVQENPSRGKTMLVLCVATSLDAAAVGLSMAMLNTHVIFPSIVIGLVSFGLSLVGLFAGNKLGCLFGKRMEVLGGLILIGIGLRILITHTME